MLKSEMQTRIETLESALEEVADEIESGDPDFAALKDVVHDALSDEDDEEVEQAE